MHDLRAALVERLEESGLQVDASAHLVGADSVYGWVLSRGATRQDYRVELASHVTFSGIGDAARTKKGLLPVMVGAASLSPRSADALRRSDTQYVDAAGNAWIHFGDVLIDVRGRARHDREPHDAGAMRHHGNLFSTGRAQVAFVLLEWPRSWKKPQRHVAEAAGVSLGQTHNALAMFRQAGFGPGGHRTDAEFLDLWVASYPSGLARKLVLATYRGSIDDFDKVGAEGSVFVDGAVVSGEVAATGLLRPAALKLYVDELDPMLPVKNRWRSDGDANITVSRKFWRTPPDEPDDSDGLGGFRHAPVVLVYADLMASADQRVRDAALEWRERLA